MKKKLFFVAVLLFATVSSFAVCKHENYIGDNDVAGWMWQYYGSWQPGSAPAGTENDNFFIGRVRPLKRFTNVNSQVLQDSKKDMRRQRKVLWWCPINEGGWTSLPRYAFDSEAFSSWSYIDIHGNWTQGLLRQPGAFADVCHKNGVATSVVSAAPWAEAQTNYDGGHGQNYYTLTQGGADKLMQLLKYYGIDGIGFNSEQTWESFTAMKNLLFNCHSLRDKYDMDLLHFDFYNLSSSLSASSSYCGSTSFDCFFPAANGFFLNYNWGNLSGSVSSANTLINNAGGNFSEYVSSYDVYGGMDMQGRSSAGWSYIDQAAASVGIWGAHNKCMPYEGATEDGSTPIAIQKCYLRKCEQLFTGGTRNPVNNLAISSKLCSGTPDFFGISKLVAAKSSLSWVANDYFPFISYFNLGNGQFFKNEGETTYNDEWYNIGIQDFLPTWRWWITTEFMGRETSKVPSGFSAEFTYEDAWFGGSCLKIENTNAANTSVYLQLFKTQFPIATGYEFTIRYKVLSGSATLQWVGSKEGSESTAVTRPIGAVSAANASEWTERTIATSTWTAFNGSTLAVLGLRFVNPSADFKMLIGEISLKKASDTFSPVKPTLTKSQILKTTYKGVDFKVIWDCPVAGSGSGSGSGAGGGTTTPEQETAVRAATLSCTISGTSKSTRSLSSVSFSGTNGASLSATVNSGSGKSLYYDLRDTKSLQVKRGETISTTPSYSGEWMMGYIYIDWNNDGDFEDSGEYMASPYNIRNGNYYTSNYAKPNDFTIPEDAELGTYTMRYTIDWNSKDGNDAVDEGASYPCGRTNSTASGNYTANNGGCMVDIELHVTAGSGSGSGGGAVTDGSYIPTYNDEIDAWYFEIWAQQSGKEAQLITATTSWAGYAVDVPIDMDGTKTVRVGVRTVAPDGKTKSDIAWSNYLDVSQITILEGYSIDKPVIKVNEEFTVSFDDPGHSSATSWKILDAKTQTTVATFNNCTSFTTSLSNLGVYDVQVTYYKSGVSTTEVRRGMIQVSDESVGAMPKIYTLTTDKEAKNNEISNDEVVTLSYTGRPADGTTSRALRLQEKPFCVQNSQFFNAAGIGNSTPITIAFWFNPLQFIDAGDAGGNTGFGDNGTQMLNIRRPTDGWPSSDWGYMWSGIHNGGNDYWVNIQRASQAAGVNYTTMTQNFVIPTANWTHIAISVIGNSTSNKDVQLYVNGRKVSDAVQNKATVATLSATHYIFMGGTAFNRSGFDGLLDEFQIWTKQFDESTINQTMVHYNAGEVPSELVCYWDFEQDATGATDSNGANTLLSRGSLVDKAKVYAVVGQTWRAVQGEGDGIVGSDPMVESNRMAPTFGVGTPFLAGRYEVITTPSWTFDGIATQGASTGDGEAGSTTVSWASMADAPYKAKLTLANSWGSDTKEVEMIDAAVKLDEAGEVIEDLSVYPNPFTESLHIRFIDKGEYEMEVFNIVGQKVQSKVFGVEQYETISLNLSGEAGLYIVRLKKDGKYVKSFKLEKK